MTENGKVVFFDIGGTLLRADPPVPEVFTRVARRRGNNVTVRDVEPCMPDIDAFYEAEYKRDGDFWCVHERAVQIWLDMYSMMARYCELDDDYAALAQDVYDEYLNPENWSLFPDVEACLKGLKRRGFRLGVISNWDATLEGLIRSVGFLQYFDDVVASAAVGYRKPSSAIFEVALERMGARPEDAYHVGDLPEADGWGASQAGISPIIIDRKGVLENCPYPTVRVLSDIVSMI